MNKYISVPIRVPPAYHGKKFKQYCVQFLEQYKGKIWEGSYIIDIVPTYEYTEPIISNSVAKSSQINYIDIMMSCIVTCKDLNQSNQIATVTRLVSSYVVATSGEMILNVVPIENMPTIKYFIGMQLPLSVGSIQNNINLVDNVKCKAFIYGSRPNMNIWKFNPLTEVPDIIHKYHKDIKILIEEINQYKRSKYFNDLLYKYKSDMTYYITKTLDDDIFSTKLDGYYSHFSNLKTLDTKLQRIPNEMLSSLINKVKPIVSTTDAYVQMLQEFLNNITILRDMCKVYDVDDVFNKHEELWNYYNKIKK